jgi:hypothetical protein
MLSEINKMFPNYDSRRFSNIMIGDGFSPVSNQ